MAITLSATDRARIAEFSDDPERTARVIELCAAYVRRHRRIKHRRHMTMLVALATWTLLAGAAGYQLGALL